MNEEHGWRERVADLAMQYIARIDLRPGEDAHPSNMGRANREEVAQSLQRLDDFTSLAAFFRYNDCPASHAVRLVPLEMWGVDDIEQLAKSVPHLLPELYLNNEVTGEKSKLDRIRDLHWQAELALRRQVIEERQRHHVLSAVGGMVPERACREPRPLRAAESMDPMPQF